MNWGLLNKASGEQGITYYRTDPYLPSSGSDVLMQGAFSLESTHGARTGYVVLDFTRENFDNLLNGFIRPVIHCWYWIPTRSHSTVPAGIWGT